MKKLGKITLVSLLLSQLSSCYLLNQGYNLLKYNFSAKPLDTVYKDPQVSKKTKERIQLIYEIREFAIDKIGLKQNQNYTKYVELNNKNYLVNVLVASKTDKLEAYQWSFPFFGSFPYKGFYDLQEARTEEKYLKNQGYDTYIRSAGAFSTLGWFDDPIYSFMLNYSTEYLANLIIHEMTHATVFVKDNIQFNEELASFVGNQGAIAFLEHKYGTDSREYKTSFALKEDNKTFSDYIKEFYGTLNKNYNDPDKDQGAKLASKKEIFSQYKDKFYEVAKNFKVKNSYAWFPKMELNNAVIMNFITYDQDYSLYEKLYEKEGKDLKNFVSFLQKIQKEASHNPKEYLKNYLEEEVETEKNEN